MNSYNVNSFCDVLRRALLVLLIAVLAQCCAMPLAAQDDDDDEGGEMPAPAEEAAPAEEGGEEGAGEGEGEEGGEAGEGEGATEGGEGGTETEGGTGDASTPPPADGGEGDEVEPVDPEKQRAATLVEEAIVVATRNRAARPALARGAAALLPQLQGRTRMGLTNRWVALITTSAVPRGLQLSAFNAFFDVAAARDPNFARRVALMLPDPAARAGGFLRISEAVENRSWDRAAEDAALAQRAARQEQNPAVRARLLTYIANRLASLNPVTREAAVIEASSHARLLGNARLRESLLAGVAGSAAKFDIALAQRIASTIADEDLKNLATARITMAQASSGLAVKTDAEKVEAIVKGVSRYDTSFIPVLLQLPATPEVFQALGDALPPIQAGGRPAANARTLERIWAFAEKAEPSVYRDQLQSRLARLMVLHDIWRGREWGRQLAWEGGRDQNARFVEATIAARESELKSEPLRSLAEKDANRAILQARRMEPGERVEALLLIAGQILA